MNHYEAALREIYNITITSGPLTSDGMVEIISLKASEALAVPAPPVEPYKPDMMGTVTITGDPIAAPPSAQEVEAGEFAEWTSINDWDYNSSQERWCQFMHIGEDDAVYYTTTALINLFKQSKTE